MTISISYLYPFRGVDPILDFAAVSPWRYVPKGYRRVRDENEDTWDFVETETGISVAVPAWNDRRTPVKRNDRRVVQAHLVCPSQRTDVTEAIRKLRDCTFRFRCAELMPFLMERHGVFMDPANTVLRVKLAGKSVFDIEEHVFTHTDYL